MVQPEFGRRLRRARLAAGLSQAELAGEAYTNSYVSYLESGRRAPTHDVAAYLAERLGTTAAVLGFADGETTDLDNRITHELLVGDKAISRHEWGAALAAAERGLALAQQTSRQGRRWEVLHLKCRTLMESGDFPSAAALAHEMSDDVVASMSPLLRAEALTLAARALRGSGQLAEAVSAATAALSPTPADETVEIEGLLQLIAARAELGEGPESLASDVARLAALGDGLAPGHTRGRVLWTIGNIAYLAGDPTAGADAHDKAAQMILAPVDLALFGRLHRVIAHFRLLNGVIDGVANELAMARQASELVGRGPDLVELAVEEARLSHLEGSHVAALHQVDDALASDVMAIAFVGRAEALELRAEILIALGREAEARATYRRAARDFEAMAALPRALAAWRLAAGGGGDEDVAAAHC